MGISFLPNVHARFFLNSETHMHTERHVERQTQIDREREGEKIWKKYIYIILTKLSTVFHDNSFHSTQHLLWNLWSIFRRFLFDCVMQVHKYYVVGKLKQPTVTDISFMYKIFHTDAHDHTVSSVFSARHRQSLPTISQVLMWTNICVWYIIWEWECGNIHISRWQ